MKKLTSLFFLILLSTLICTGVIVYSMFINESKPHVLVCGVESNQIGYCTKNPQRAIDLGFYPNKTGELLYKSNCKSCHDIKYERVGPPFEKIIEGNRSKEWIYKFVKDPSEMIRSKDSTSLILFEKYQVLMPGFPSLTNAEIDSIFAYIKHESIASF